jgi:MoaA/NifB/PqqE/SkfB family radical SAM enzyme
MASPVTIPTSMLFSTEEFHIELSSRCVLKCPRCPRTELADKLKSSLNQDYSLEQFTQIWTPEVLARTKRILFCGDKGDPIYAKDFLEIVEYIKTTNPHTILHITTNGSYKSSGWWHDLGELLREFDKVTFSVDGWDQASNNMYRINNDFESICTGVRTLVASKNRPIVHWSTIVFRFNQHKIDNIKKLAEDLGCDSFTVVNSTKVGSIDQNYLDENGIDALEPEVNNAVNLQTYSKKNHSLRKRSHPTGDFLRDGGAYNYGPGKPWQACLRKEQVPFVSVEGLFYPCAWFDSGYIHNSFGEKYRSEINVREHGIQGVLENKCWEELTTRWTIAPLEICKLKCYKNAK